MKKLLIFFFVGITSLLLTGSALAVCNDPNATCQVPRAVCTTLGAGYHQTSGSCRVGAFGGHCCSSASYQDTGGPSSWGSWGNTPAGSSLSDFSNLLGAGAPNNSSKASWQNVIATFISLLYLAAIVVSGAFLILGGYNWMFSGGDKQKIEKSRQHVTFAIVGLVIIFISVLIISILGSFFGINFLNP